MSEKYAVGDDVTVRRAYPPGHVRTPYFIRGRRGVVQEVVGKFANPEELAYGRDGNPALTLYRVQFYQNDVWTNYNGSPKDTALVDIYENWLEPA
ncbi:MAG: Nitrile hydratase subunit beta [Alphaproteobacteria bacterium MarineAlpha4_Bin2]|nr:MAG: Nitrile hydratase subunit beta [Alphaproteobacteria bacterium MarineAlpha4_Bin2]